MFKQVKGVEIAKNLVRVYESTTTNLFIVIESEARYQNLTSKRDKQDFVIAVMKELTKHAIKWVNEK